MARLIRWCLPAALFLFAAGSLWAADKGQKDLDKATEAKLTAETVGDLSDVIRLTESALEKGLDEANTGFAKKLLYSTLIQRASEMMHRALPSAISADAFQQARNSVLADLEKAAKLDPKQVQVYLLVAQVGDAKQAKEALDKALELGFDEAPARAKALLLRAGLQEQPEKKLADFDEAVRLMPDDALTIRARGFALADMGKLDAALVDLDRAIELDPADVRTYQGKAIVLARLKRYDESLAALEKAKQLNPDSVAPLVEEARVHAQQDKPDAALEDLNNALKLDANNAAVLLLRAELYREKGEKETALADMDRVLKLKPDLVVAVRMRASLLVEMDKLEAALVDLDKLTQLEPKDVRMFEAKANILTRLKRYDEALATLEKALALDADKLELLLLRAGIYQEKGDKEKAMDEVDRALKLKPDFPMAIRTRALLLAENKRFDDAIGELEKLRKLDPKDTKTLLQLAVLYGIQKKVDQAIDAYSAVLDEEPEEWRALQGRADLCLNFGKHAEAVADYEKAMKLHPKGEELLKDPDNEALVKNLQSLLNNFAWVLATSPDDKLRDGKRAIQLATEACELSQYKLAYILSTLAAAYAETGDFDAAVKWSSKAVEIGDPKHNESLKKELETYKAKKPMRERLTGDEPVEDEDNDNSKKAP
jgi:tetratricopeptide (TPR) repeat protein